MNTSVMTACIPSLHRVVAELRTNRASLVVPENLELSLGGEKAFGNLSRFSASRTTNGSAMNQSTSSQERGNPVPYGHNADRRMGGTTSVVSVKTKANGSSKAESRSVGRAVSQEHLRQDPCITRTMGFSVEEDDQANRPSDSERSMQ